MKLFIPELGTKLQLCSDFTFSLSIERRNESLLDFFGNDFKAKQDLRDAYFNFYYYGNDVEKYWRKRLAKKTLELIKLHHPEGITQAEAKEKYDAMLNMPKPDRVTITLPKNTILEIDRIYIRAGLKDFSSITFKWRHNKRVYRFWIKLEDANKIECEIVGNQDNEQWPNGRFQLSDHDDWKSCNCGICGKYRPEEKFLQHVYASRSYCQCLQPTFPLWSSHVLKWISDPKCARTKIISSRHCFNTAGYNVIDEKGYSRLHNPISYQTLDDLIQAAKHRGFSQEHIDAFIKKHKEANAL